MSSFQSAIQLGAATSLRADAVLTTAYVASSSVDLKSYDSVSVRVAVGAVADAARTGNIKFQWSIDDLTWNDEPINVNGTPSGTELHQTPYSRVIDLNLASGRMYIERFERLMRYFRVSVKSDAATAATVLIESFKLSNG